MSTDPLHPTGRCTCGGEGSCVWCLSHCIYCGSTVWPCDEDLALDYEALGYPETEVTDAICGTEEMRYTVDLFLGSVMGDMDERLVRLRLIEKKNDDPLENG